MALAAALPVAALAHPGADAGAHHTLLQGLAHPFSGIDHLLAMLAAGLWGALRGGRARWLAPLAFMSLLIVGAGASAAGWAVPAVEPMVAASLLASGLLVATRGRAPAGPALALIGTFAFFHGAAHGHELGAGAALAGMALGSLVLHIAGLALGTVLHRHAQRWSPVVGAGLAGAGIALLLG
jgi:urease accessory protein